MSSAKGNILVVEDEALIAMTLQMQMDELGFDTIVATTMTEALAAARDLPLRLAIVDYDLQGEKTTAVAAILRERGIPIVVCSGSQFEDIQGVFAGAAVLNKPYLELEMETAVLIATAH